jgi:predicted Zn-dependent protease
MIQLLRVQLAEKTSSDAYHQALDELTRDYPDDPSLALMQIDGAFLRGDLDGALHAIDVLDGAVGGDPFQDAVRAEVYVKRGKPGDLELAAARADAAIKAEPTLAKGWWSRLDVAVRAKNYALAAETMKHLEDHFGAKFDEAALRKIEGYGEFLDSPEYKALRGG